MLKVIQPKVIHLRSTDTPVTRGDNRPGLLSGRLHNLSASSAFPGGGSATITVAGPAPLPTTGWATTAGSNTTIGTSGNRVKAVFTGGGGSGAAGYFVLNSSGALASLVITNPGTNYNGTVTATPFYGMTNIWFDLGPDWDDYNYAALAASGLVYSDSLLRVVAYGARDGLNVDLMLPCNLSGGNWTEAFINGFTGGSPARMIRPGTRYIRIDATYGLDTGAGDAINLVCYPS